jgi:hypothetical protein
MEKIASGWLQRLHRAIIDMFAVNPLTRKFQEFKGKQTTTASPAVAPW